MPTDRTDDIPQWLIDRPLLLTLAALNAFPPLTFLIGAYVVGVIAVMGLCVYQFCREVF